LVLARVPAAALRIVEQARRVRVGDGAAGSSESLERDQNKYTAPVACLHWLPNRVQWRIMKLAVLRSFPADHGGALWGAWPGWGWKGGCT
jgi:hypothetical protein